MNKISEFRKNKNISQSTLAELRIKGISSNLNNNIKQKQKEDEQLWALNEGWKIELENKNKEIKELKEKYNKDTNQLQNQIYRLNVDKINNYISKAKIEKMYIEMEQEYERKVYDNNYNRTEVKKEEMYKRQVYEKLLESEE